MIIDEVTLYNMDHAATRAADTAKWGARAYAEALMITHLYREHGMGIRDLAKRFNMKMIDVKKAIIPAK